MIRGYCGDHEKCFLFSQSESILGAKCRMYVKGGGPGLQDGHDYGCYNRV